MDNQIKEIVESVNELSLNLCVRIDDICNKYRLNNELENDRIINLIEDLNALSEGINIIKAEFSSINLLELNEKLDMLYSAFEGKDYPLFTDILAYELKPLFEYWIECLKK